MFKLINKHKQLFLMLYLSLISACATNPSVDFDLQAAQYKLQKHNVSGQVFDYSLYANASRSIEHLHVYIGGDGNPWLENRYKSKDPTTRRKTALALMALDQGPAIYLGRPCYHNNGNGRGCSNKWWTSHRYSKTVVDDMHRVLDQYLTAHNIQSLTLIGFSGGGAIAMLLAPLLKQTAMVITINGNLDTDAWVRAHRYTPLLGSLNPASQEVLPENIRKIHLIGQQDKNIPGDSIIEHFAKQQNTKIISYPKFTHHCCWNEIWPDFLAQM